MNKSLIHFSPKARQAGFTLVEMMVALAISMIVMLGFAVTFVNIKQSFVSQDKVTQLQDNERLAMTLLGASVQEAGFFPQPATLDSSQIVAANSQAGYGTMVAGQAIVGTAGPDTLSIAFAASANDGLITCQGHTISAADITAAGGLNGSVGVRNIFYVDATAKTLNCIALVNDSTTSTYGGGTGQPLVTNVASMSVLYGVGGTGGVTGYFDASTVPSWLTVKSLRVTLNFVNPNDATATIPWVQTINLMNR